MKYPIGPRYSVAQKDSRIYSQLHIIKLQSNNPSFIGLQTDPSIWDLAPNIHSVTTRYPTQNLPKNNKSSSGSMKCQKPSPCPEQNFWSIFGGFLGTDLGGLQNIVIYSILGLRPSSVNPLRFTLFWSLPPPMPPINRISPQSPLEITWTTGKRWSTMNIHADSWKSWKNSQKWLKKQCYNTLIKAMFGCE